MLTVPAAAFGDIALVPAPFLKHPRGIRAVEEWYVSTVLRKDYVREVFERQCRIAEKNIETLISGGHGVHVVITASDWIKLGNVIQNQINARYELKLANAANSQVRARIEDKVEKLAAADAIRAVKFAEVVVILLDATIPFEKQDLTIIDLCEREGRAVVIGLNKWDLIEKRGATLSTLKEEATRLLPQIKGCPIVPLSGLSGQGIDRLMEGVMQMHALWNKRISTSKINRWLSGVLSNHPPPAVSGRRIKLRYMTQTKTRPPQFTLFGNQLDALPESYRRYLVNSIRESFELPGVPVRLNVRTNDNPFDKGR